MRAFDLVGDYRLYTRRFNRTEYPVFFGRYLEAARPYFDGLQAGETGAEVRGLIDALEADWAKHRLKFRRSAVREDDKLLLALYLAPAAIEHGSEAAREFAKELSMEWNERFPDSVFRVGTYAAINKGFNKGFKLPWAKEAEK